MEKMNNNHLVIELDKKSEACQKLFQFLGALSTLPFFQSQLVKKETLKSDVKINDGKLKLIKTAEIINQGPDFFIDIKLLKKIEPSPTFKLTLMLNTKFTQERDDLLFEKYERKARFPKKSVIKIYEQETKKILWDGTKK